MIAELIKEHTSTHHQALEASMIRRIKSITVPQDYIDLLGVFYSYFGGLEKSINPAISDILPDMGDRRKAEALANDIEYFKGEIPALASGSDLPVIENHQQAMAALYVIEGSTLGGIYISKMIAKQLQLETKAGLTFFEGYGEETKPMWEDFKKVLNAQPSNDAEEQEMIATANDTFLKFKHWLDKN